MVWDGPHAVDPSPAMGSTKLGFTKPISSGPIGRTNDSPNDFVLVHCLAFVEPLLLAGGSDVPFSGGYERMLLPAHTFLLFSFLSMIVPISHLCATLMKRNTLCIMHWS